MLSAVGHHGCEHEQHAADKAPEGAVNARREHPALGGGKSEDVPLEDGDVSHMAWDGAGQVVLPEHVARAPAAPDNGCELV